MMVPDDRRNDFVSAADVQTETAENSKKRYTVDMETAERFLDATGKRAGALASGVMLCILSPALLVFLVSGSGTGSLKHLTETEATGIGMTVLLLMVAVAVVILVSSGIHSQSFEYIRTEPLDTEYETSEMVRGRKDGYGAAHTRDLTLGVVLCVLSSLPLIMMTLLSGNDGFMIGGGVAVLLILVGIGAFLIVRTSTIWGGYEALLEEGDYTRGNKKLNKHLGSLYWSIVTAVYLLISFLTMRWDRTWIIWPVMGCMYGAVVQIYKTLKK